MDSNRHSDRGNERLTDVYKILFAKPKKHKPKKKHKKGALVKKFFSIKAV
jgi:hypothetical protein